MCQVLRLEYEVRVTGKLFSFIFRPFVISEGVALQIVLTVL